VNNNSALMAIIRASRCPYASSAHLDASPMLHADSNPQAIAAAEAPHIRRYLSALVDSRSDGYALEITQEDFGSDARRLAQGFAELLNALAIELGGGPLDSAQVTQDGWWFTLGGVRHFVLAFAPCYPANSSRSTAGGSSTFVIFQPVSAFERAAHNGLEIDNETRRWIRNAFARGGRPYSAAIAAGDDEAAKFLMSIDAGDLAIDWWHHLDDRR
jgi:hypothetical protein